MQKLMASDVLYAAVVRPEIDGVLAANGIEGSDVPKSVFLPEGTKWLDESAVSSALGSVSGSSGEASTPGVHGLGLTGTASTARNSPPNRRRRSPAKKPRKWKCEVQNQGESTENGVTVSVTVNGGNTPAAGHQHHRRRRNRVGRRSR